MFITHSRCDLQNSYAILEFSTECARFVLLHFSFGGGLHIGIDFLNVLVLTWSPQNP